MLVFVYRRDDRYPAFRLQLEQALSATELEPGLMEAPQQERVLWDRMAGVRGVYKLLAQANTARDLVACVSALALKSPPFVIDHDRLGHNPESIHSKKLCGQLALVIEGNVSFKRPEVRFRFFETERGYYFARHLHTPISGIAPYAERPVGFSSAIPPELAAAAINAVANPGDRLVDPTCGSGTILYEASVRGMVVWGYDINWNWVRGARENLAHFGVEPGLGVERLVSRGDARTIDFSSDVVVANLPYGRRTRTTDAVVEDILRNLYGRAKRYGYFTGWSVEQTLKSIGYRDVCEVDVSGGSKERRFLSLGRL